MQMQIIEPTVHPTQDYRKRQKKYIGTLVSVQGRHTIDDCGRGIVGRLIKKRNRRRRG